MRSPDRARTQIAHDGFGVFRRSLRQLLNLPLHPVGRVEGEASLDIDELPFGQKWYRTHAGDFAVPVLKDEDRIPGILVSENDMINIACDLIHA